MALCLFLAVCFAPVCLWGADSTQQVSELKIRYAGEFNHVPTGCRTIALGNTGVVLPYSDLSSFWNPSLIGLLQSYQVHIEGAKLYGGLSSLGALAFSAPIQKGISAGITYRAFFPDNITEYDSLPGTYWDRIKNYNIDGYPSKGIFHNNQHNIILSLAKNFSVPIPRPNSFNLPLPVDISVGLNIKSLWMTMTPGEKVRMGYNINLDVGFILRIGLDYDLAKKRIMRELLLGVSLRDFLPTPMTWLHSYENYEEPIDGSEFYGISYIDRSGFLFGNWTVAVALQRNYDLTFHAGLEGEFFDIVTFRCGVSNGVMTLGAGIHYKRYSIDYSFTFDDLDYSFLRLGVGVQF
jgi:hypothetical protein